MDGASFYSCP
jgi:hypothetical protein